MSDSGLSVSDELAIRNLLAKYGHTLDEGTAEEWAGLFTEDASWERLNVPPRELGGSGLPAEVRRGRDVLVRMAREVIDDTFRRRVRHQMTDVYVEAGDSPDAARAQARCLITDWRDGPGKIAMVGSYAFDLAHTPQGWRIKAVRCDLLPKA